MKKFLTAAFLLAYCSGCMNPNSDKSSEKPRPPLVALENAPEFELENVAGGSLKSSELKGKVVLVDFWATWCAPCKTEIPEYNKMIAQLRDKNVEFVGVVFESGDKKNVMPFVKEFSMAYPVVIGTNGVDTGFGGHLGTPTTFLIGRDWKVYRRFIGSTSDKIEGIRKDIDALIALK